MILGSVETLGLFKDTLKHLLELKYFMKETVNYTQTRTLVFSKL